MDDLIDAWTPGRILDHLEKGYVVPPDWRERLIRAGFKVDDEGQQGFDL